MRFIAERIKAEALSLAHDEREEIARTLARSLRESEPGWYDETTRRFDEFRSGRGAMLPGEEFSAELEQFLNEDVPA